jgi:hypothetical protein
MHAGSYQKCLRLLAIKARGGTEHWREKKEAERESVREKK